MGTRRGICLPPERSGFTLLEMCFVLLIMVLLFGVSLPALQSAFVEQEVRADSHELAIMVKTGMLRASEQHRPYLLELTSSNLDLHPVAAPDNDKTLIPVNTDDGSASLSGDATATWDLNAANKLVVPDAEKAHAWTKIPDTTWTFQPGELCPATRVRFNHGSSYLEMSFNALTGNVENEATFFP